MAHHWSPDRCRDGNLYLTPGFDLLALWSALEILKLANRATRRDVFRWRTVSHTGEAVNASCGISVATDNDLARERRHQSHPDRPLIVVVCVRVQRQPRKQSAERMGAGMQAAQDHDRSVWKRCRRLGQIRAGHQNMRSFHGKARTVNYNLMFYRPKALGSR